MVHFLTESKIWQEYMSQSLGWQWGWLALLPTPTLLVQVQGRSSQLR